MSIVLNSLVFLAVLLIALLCGYGVVVFLLPRRLGEKLSFIIMPPLGYSFLSWLAFTLSVGLGLKGKESVLLGFVLLSLVSVTAYLVHMPRLKTVNGTLSLIMTSSSILLVILWPLFYVGPDTYLAAVNPDYSSNLIDTHYLMENPPDSPIDNRIDSYSNFYSAYGRITKSARFGGCYFAILVHCLLNVSLQSALTLSIGLFVFCIPLSVFFLARVAFDAKESWALLCSLIVGVSGPTAMSYVYHYVGQNSGLGLLPTCVAILYLGVVETTLPVVILCALTLSSFYVLYAGMLPYAMTPVGLAFTYKTFRGKVRPFSVLKLFSLVAFAVLLLNIGNLRYFAAVASAWSRLVAESRPTFLFSDFLTESFFPISLGLVSYPPSSSIVSQWLGEYSMLFLLLVSVTVCITLLAIGFERVKQTRMTDSTALGLSALVVYGSVWFLFTFRSPQGYAVFKMSSWLQFLYAVLLGGSLVLIQRRYRIGKKVTGILFLLVLLLTVLCNVLSSFQTMRLSLGKDPVHGTIVNVFDISGNDDYLNLEKDIRKHVRSASSVGIAFSDYVQNKWISYYLRDHKLSWFGHYVLPADEENLPDIETREVKDLIGNLTLDKNPYFHGTNDEFYLTWSEDNPNRDVTEQDYPPPVWRNRTFRLFRSDECHDFIFMGRGWYRVERAENNREFWMPKRFRWTAQGGEIYLLRAQWPRQPYRLAFVGIVGFGLDSSKRMVELWHNKRKFDEFEINDAARIVSAPFYPNGDVDLISLKVRENTRPKKRRFGMWNRDIPADYRRLNLMVAEIKVLGPQSELSVEEAHEPIRSYSIMSKSLSFNGLHQDLWMGECMSIELIRPKRAKALRITFLSPQYKDLHYPNELTINLDGTEHKVMIESPGNYTYSFPLDILSDCCRTRINFKVTQSFVPKFSSPEDRPIRQSLRLESINFEHIN